MISEKWHGKIRAYMQFIQRYTDRYWYAPFVGLLAALDNFALLIPTEGLLISSSMITPKRWFILALCVAVGSTLGAVVLAALVELRGLPWILELYPNISSTKMWTLSMEFFEKYGLLLVFTVAITPVIQQPAVILAGLANTPLIELAAIIFTGRFIKYMIMTYLGSHAPRLLKKMWGVKGDLQDVGVKLK